MTSIVVTKLWCFDRNVKKCHKVQCLKKSIWWPKCHWVKCIHCHVRSYGHTKDHTRSPGKSARKWQTPKGHRLLDRACSSWYVLARNEQRLRFVDSARGSWKVFPGISRHSPFVPCTRSLVTFTWNQKGHRLLHGCSGKRRFPMASVAKWSPKKMSVGLLWTCGHWRCCAHRGSDTCR